MISLVFIILSNYSYFDDGKIRESRRNDVTITDFIPFDEIDAKTKLDWKEDVDDCDWLYSLNTDYFIKGILNIGDKIEIVFVRTLDNRWFSLGHWGGLLDVSGKLTQGLNE